jgi:chemotaxis protein CheZ
MRDPPMPAGARRADPARDRVTQALKQIDRNMVTEVVTAVLTTMTGDLSPTETSLLSEVEALGRTISSAKQEIADLRVDDIRDRDIPFATDELDAIVQHTAVATNAILESCEIMEEVAGTVTGDAASRLQDAITKIYEACSFQDITGQRITKVVTTLKTIEAKVAQIIATFGVQSPPMEPGIGLTGAASDAELLNGPQLPSNAMDQSDIDKLLASFG